MKNLSYALLFALSAICMLSCNKNNDVPIGKKSTTTHSLTSTADSVTTPIVYNTTAFTGDQITLVPHLHGSLADSSYVSFVAQTKNSYCESSKMDISTNLANDNYTIDLIDVVQPSPCAIGEGPIGQALTFKQTSGAPSSTGTFPLKVTLNGTTYTGSITATATTITFDWNYTAGVLINPKQISR